MVDVRISCKAEQLLLCSISLTFTLAVKDKKWRGKRDSINILHVTFIKRYLQYSCKSKKSLRMNHVCPWGWQHRQRNSAEHVKVKGELAGCSCGCSVGPSRLIWASWNISDHHVKHLLAVGWCLNVFGYNTSLFMWTASNTSPPGDTD